MGFSGRFVRSKTRPNSSRNSTNGRDTNIDVAMIPPGTANADKPDQFINEFTNHPIGRARTPDRVIVTNDPSSRERTRGHTDRT